MAKMLVILCQELERRRREKGFTQTEVAELLGVKQSRVSSIGRGSVPRDLAVLHNYARILDVDFVALVRQIRVDLAALEPAIRNIKKTIHDADVAFETLKGA